jgi:hypothetical protein
LRKFLDLFVVKSTLGSSIFADAKERRFMTVAISHRPLAPLLSHYLTEIPQKVADDQGRRATLYGLASKVCIVALIAIVGGALSISFGLLMPIQPALSLALILSTFPLQLGFQTFMMRSLDCSEKAKQAIDKAVELARIQHWQKPQIVAFLKEHKFSLEKLPLSLLHRVTPKEPLRALLPAIASYNYFSNKTQKQFKEHEENLHNAIEDPTLRYEGRRHGWRVLEFHAIPTALQAALVLQIISCPDLQFKLGDLGRFLAKEFDQRRFDQLLDGTDDFFVFKEKGRAALSFAEAHRMVSKHDIDGLRRKLFEVSRKT